METYLICLAIALVGGLMLSRLTKKLNLPAVTAYLVAGLLLGKLNQRRRSLSSEEKKSGQARIKKQKQLVVLAI